MKPIKAEPGFHVYPDTGCEAAPACLSCPLARCKYDDPAYFQRQRRRARDLKVVTTMRLEGLTVEAAAERFSVTVRTIWRAKARLRQELLKVRV
jgi:hypothetical protein